MATWNHSCQPLSTPPITAITSSLRQNFVTDCDNATLFIEIYGEERGRKYKLKDEKKKKLSPDYCVLQFIDTAVNKVKGAKNQCLGRDCGLIRKRITLFENYVAERRVSEVLKYYHYTMECRKRHS